MDELRAARAAGDTMVWPSEKAHALGDDDDAREPRSRWSDDELERRIARAEAQVHKRDAQLRERSHEVGDDLALLARRIGVAVLAAGAGYLVMRQLMRRRAPRTDTPQVVWVAPPGWQGAAAPAPAPASAAAKAAGWGGLAGLLGWLVPMVMRVPPPVLAAFAHSLRSQWRDRRPGAR